MSQISFNVLTEPWIPVVHMDGYMEELGILGCLEKSHKLRGIQHPVPIVELGLHRLLVAFILDAYILAGKRPKDTYDLAEIIESGCFDMGLFNSYAEDCGDVFDLFHRDKPFLQSAGGTGRTKPLAAMFPALPSGTSVIHWHHEHEKQARVTWNEAACLLTTIAPFMTAGGAGLSPSINGAPAIYALPLGVSLFQTLLINIPLRNQDTGEGIVAWRSARQPGQERNQATTTEALTWRPRVIQLIPGVDDRGNTFVQEIFFAKGDSTRLNWIDASLSYRYDDQGSKPVRMKENRPLWRDAGPLLLLKEDQHGQHGRKVAFQRPDVVEQAFEMQTTGDRMLIQAYGMRTDMKMKVFEWAKSTWSVPAKLGRSTRLGALVQNEIDKEDSVAFSLRTAIRRLFPREGTGNKSALKTVCDRCERGYWLQLELGFHPLMEAFSKLDPDSPDDSELISKTAMGWRDMIRNIAINQFELAADDMDADGDALERLIRSRSWIRRRIEEVLS